jgi:hypothetical protein
MGKRNKTISGQPSERKTNGKLPLYSPASLRNILTLIT